MPAALYEGSTIVNFCDIESNGLTTWVAVWESKGDSNVPIGSDGDIFFRRSDDGGTSWNEPLPLNSNATADTRRDFAPVLATDKNGTWLVLWGSQGSLGDTLGTDPDILFVRSIDDGITWSEPVPLNTDASSDSAAEGPLWGLRYGVATDRNGTWIAVWNSQEGSVGGDFDIRFARSEDNGANWSPPAPLNNDAVTDGAANDVQPNIATDERGNWIVVWHSNNDRDGTVGTDYDITVAVSTDNGATWSDPAPLNRNAAVDSGWDYVSWKSFATDRKGHWVVTWETSDDLEGTIGTERDILVARSANHGLTWTAPTPLNTNAAFDDGFDTRMSLATDGRGVWISVWWTTDSGLGGSGPDLTDTEIAAATFTLTTPIGDLNGDHLLNLKDAAIFQRCFSGDVPGMVNAECCDADFDIDDDIDLWDYVGFYESFVLGIP
jgi:hypothetical protein